MAPPPAAATSLAAIVKAPAKPVSKPPPPVAETAPAPVKPVETTDRKLPPAEEVTATVVVAEPTPQSVKPAAEKEHELVESMPALDNRIPDIVLPDPVSAPIVPESLVKSDDPAPVLKTNGK